jgi:hypothetical protein
VLWSQLILGFFLVLCTVLNPHYLFEQDEGGVSNFGTLHATIIPYSLAFWGSALLLLVAAYGMDTRDTLRKIMKRLILAVAVLLLLVVITTYPYKLNDTLSNIHGGISIVLLVTEMAGGVWIAKRVQRDAFNSFILGVLGFGFLLALLATFGILHLLFIAQTLTSASFAVLLVRATEVVL